MALIRLPKAKLKVGWLQAADRAGISMIGTPAQEKDAGKHLWSRSFNDWEHLPCVVTGTNNLVYTKADTNDIDSEDPNAVKNLYCISDGRDGATPRHVVKTDMREKVLRPSEYFAEHTRRVYANNKDAVQANYTDTSVWEPDYRNGVRTILSQSGYGQLYKASNNSLISDEATYAPTIYVKVGEQFVSVRQRWLDIKAVFETERMKKFGEYVENLKFEPQDPPTYPDWVDTRTTDDGMVYQARSMLYGYEVQRSYASEFEFEYEPVPEDGSEGMTLVFNTADGTASFVPESSDILDDFDALAKAAMTEYDRTQAIDVKMASQGLYKPVNRPRPPETTSIYLTDRQPYDDWWAEKVRINENLSLMNAQNAQVGIDRYNDDLASGDTVRNTIEDYADDVRAQEIADQAENPKGWLSGLWDAIKGAAGYVGDVVKDWGPTSIIGAWAGYEAVNSAKKSSIPTWLIIGGVGLAAIAILK